MGGLPVTSPNIRLSCHMNSWPMCSIGRHRRPFGSNEVKAIRRWIWVKRRLHSSLVHKDARLTFRVPSELKGRLEAIAAEEGRSLAQICEAFVKAGVELYEKRGSECIRALVVRTGPVRSRDA